jgi:hypothetical protein
MPITALFSAGYSDKEFAATKLRSFFSLGGQRLNNSLVGQVPRRLQEGKAPPAAWRRRPMRRRERVGVGRCYRDLRGDPFAESLLSYVRDEVAQTALPGGLAEKRLGWGDVRCLGSLRPLRQTRRFISNWAVVERLHWPDARKVGRPIVLCHEHHGLNGGLLSLRPCDSISKR